MPLVGSCGSTLYSSQSVQFTIQRGSTFPELIIITDSGIDIAFPRVKVLIIVKISSQQAVGVLLRSITVITTTGSVVLHSFSRNVNLSLTFCIIVTQCSMKFQIRQEMYPVIHIRIAHKAGNFTS